MEEAQESENNDENNGLGDDLHTNVGKTEEEFFEEKNEGDEKSQVPEYTRYGFENGLPQLGMIERGVGHCLARFLDRRLLTQGRFPALLEVGENLIVVGVCSLIGHAVGVLQFEPAAVDVGHGLGNFGREIAQIRMIADEVAVAVNFPFQAFLGRFIDVCHEGACDLGAFVLLSP